MNIPHRLFPVFLFQPVAGKHIAKRINEEVSRTGLTRQHTATAFNIIYQPHIEPGTEPALRMTLLQLPFNELLEVTTHLIFISDYIVFFVEVVRIMKSSCGELHPQALAQLIERKHVFRVIVRHRAAETDILQPHFLQCQQCAKSLVETSRMTAQFVVLATQPLDGNADADIWKLLCQRHHTILKPSARRNDNTVGMPVAFLHNLRQILADERFATRQVDKLQLRQCSQITRFYLFAFVGGIKPDVAHLALHGTTISQDNTCIRRSRNSFLISHKYYNIFTFYTL